MEKIIFFIIVIFFSSVSFFAQQKKTDTKEFPVSIYTLNTFSENKNGFSAVNKRLKLSNFDFVYVRDINFGYKLFSRNSFKERTSSEFIYDNYMRFQDTKLFLDFLRKNDPTRRPWQCYQQNF